MAAAPVRIDAAQRLRVLLGLAAAATRPADVALALAGAGDRGEAVAALMALDLDLPEEVASAARVPRAMRLDEAQAAAVLDLRLYRLTRPEREGLAREIADIAAGLA